MISNNKNKNNNNNFPLIQHQQNITHYNSKKLNILYLNACSIREKIDKLCLEISSLNIQPSIIAISETWLKSDDDLNNINIQNYVRETASRPKKRGGGVCIFIHSSIKSFEYKNIYSDNVISYLSVVIELENKIKKHIHLLYNPPMKTNDDFSYFLKFFSSVLESNNGTQNFIIGDMNINIKNTDNNWTSQYLNIISQNGYYIWNDDSPTRPVSGSIIDHVISSQRSNESIQISQFSNNISDHNFIFCTFSNSSHNMKGQNIEKTIKFIDNEKIKNDLIVNPIRMDLNNNCNYVCASLLNQLNSTIQNNTSVKIVKLKQKKILPCWIDSELQYLYKILSYWLSKYKHAKKQLYSLNIEKIDKERKYWQKKFNALRKKKKKFFLIKNFVKVTTTLSVFGKILI